MTEHSRTLLIPNFCLDRPFGFSVHRDTHFCPSRLFRFSTCRVYRFSCHPFILPEPFWFAGRPLFLPRCVNLAGLWLCTVFFRLCPRSQSVGRCPCWQCCHVTRRSLFDQAGFIAGIHVQCPKWLGRRFAPGYWASWEIPWILTGLPQMIANAHAMPLDWKFFCSPDILRENFFVVWTKSHMQTKLC